jgi:hypothetical protein
MADTFAPFSKARLIEPGGYSGGNFGDPLNEDALKVLDAVATGTLTIDIGSNTTYTLEALQNGALSQTHYRRLKFIGTPATPVTITVPVSVGPWREMLIENQTGQLLTIKYAATAGVNIGDGQTVAIAADGTNVREFVVGNGITDAEVSASVMPTDYAYLPGDIRRYGANTAPGTTDMTSAIAACLLVAPVHGAYFQPETYLTGKHTPPGGSYIYLPPGCVLLDSGALGTNERLINVTNDDVHIVGYGATIQGNRAAYVSPGEQRHGVFIFGGNRIYIEGLASDGHPGDGFYIGDNAEHVKLEWCSGDDNRRQGCSITSGRHVRVVDCEFTNTNGTSPSAGLDIEPNSSSDVLEDIKIIRLRSTDNDGAGIVVFLANWNSTSNYADIDIIGLYTARNGRIDIGGRRRPGLDLNRITSTTPCRGRVRAIDHVAVDENAAGITVYDWDVNGPRLEIIRPTIINPNQQQASTSSVNGGIILHNSTSHTTAPGNVLVDSPIIRDDDGYLNAHTLPPMRISGAWDDVLVKDIQAAYAGSTIVSVDSAAKEVRVVNTLPYVIALTSNTTVSDGRYIGRTITNTGASGDIAITLIAASADRIGWRQRFEVTAAHELRIDPNGTDLIRGGTAGQYMVSSTIGDNVEIECDSATTWKIVSRYGSWSFV